MLRDHRGCPGLALETCAEKVGAGFSLHIITRRERGASAPEVFANTGLSSRPERSEVEGPGVCLGSGIADAQVSLLRPALGG
jgi:hypothetical protein